MVDPVRKRDLERLFAQAKERVSKMSKEEYDEMMEEQRKSFARAMTTPCEHGVLDFEDCPQCRETEMVDVQVPAVTTEMIKAGRDAIEHARQFGDPNPMGLAKIVLEAALSRQADAEGWREPNSGHVYTAEQLATLLDWRDKFIVSKGLWAEFTASVAASPSPDAGRAEG